ncbi:MAG: bacillithiol biosynthesis cysteine-adding enzyme BshC [Cyclobacteriaceae bacterium]|nr:bacillithiol biosynthesis cysteine-adding enzyme BshC [Cyclobacteriaceae bacterium]
MHLSKIPFSSTSAFSDFFLDYIHEDSRLTDLYNRYPHPENFRDQIREKQQAFPLQNRSILADVLTRQYEKIANKDAVSQNITLLRQANTFTVVTGHQLNVCTGPLYFVYKIITVINACRRLKKEYPEYDFVPVYWMASEDHDYDEIKHFRVKGKKYTWVTQQQGAVGRFSTQGLADLIESVPGDTSLFTSAYRKGKTLAESVRIYVHELFGAEGLVVIDADEPELKALFAPVMREDIMQGTIKQQVEKTNELLEARGYTPQVYCRDVNFFFMDGPIRNRIEKDNGRYRVVDTDIEFDAAQMEDLIATSPEKLSPNVILRPLYQEMILPNLAYTGGPAEVVYWLQLKSVFDSFGVPFPILLPRNFVLVIESHIRQKMEKVKLSPQDLFADKEELFKQWIAAHSNHDLSVDRESAAITELFNALKERAEGIDKTLGPHVAAMGKKTLTRLEGIGKKMLRAEKRIQKEKLGQIEAVKDTLFPGGGLQERTDNLLNFYPHDKRFIDELINHLDPFDLQFHVLTY